MLTQKIEYTVENIDTVRKIIIFKKIRRVYDNDVLVATGEEKKVFQPGEIEEVKTFLETTVGPEIAYLESVWTAEEIAKYIAGKPASYSGSL